MTTPKSVIDAAIKQSTTDSKPLDCLSNVNIKNQQVKQTQNVIIPEIKMETIKVIFKYLRKIVI